jgi:hypothetical protein
VHHQRRGGCLGFHPSIRLLSRIAQSFRRYDPVVSPTLLDPSHQNAAHATVPIALSVELVWHRCSDRHCQRNDDAVHIETETVADARTIAVTFTSVSIRELWSSSTAAAAAAAAYPAVALHHNGNTVLRSPDRETIRLLHPEGAGPVVRRWHWGVGHKGQTASSCAGSSRKSHSNSSVARRPPPSDDR